MLGTIRNLWTRRDDSGWTLTQLLMALAISGIGVGAALSLLRFGQQHHRHGDTVTALQQHTRTAIEWLSREVRESALESLVISGEADSAIAFASARDANSQFALGDTGIPEWQQAVVYYLKPGTTDLYRYTSAKTDWSQNFTPDTAMQEGLGEKVSGDVSELSFQLTASLLRITLATTQETESGPVTNELRTDTVIRNHL